MTEMLFLHSLLHFIFFLFLLLHSFCCVHKVCMANITLLGLSHLSLKKEINKKKLGKTNKKRLANCWPNLKWKINLLSTLSCTLMYSILPIRSVKAGMSFHRKWMRLLPLYSSAVLNICPCLPFHWKISEYWVNSKLEMNNNNIKIKNAALMPLYDIIFYTLFKKKK